MNKLSNGKLAAIIILIVIVADQALKIWVKTHFYYGEELCITSWFRLLFIENNGMAFGMEMGSKLFLTMFRVVAVCAFCYYLFKIRNRTDLDRGYVVCIALITAGAAGNTIDCLFYGLIFNDPVGGIAQLFPPDGGYGTLLHGRVVDMIYCPIAAWDWPSWMPVVGGEHFVFFQPIFNLADACLTVSVIVLLLFYLKNTENPDAVSGTATTDDNTTTIDGNQE